jgi:hypothetical protein
MKRIHKTLFIVTGVIGILSAIFGLWYNATTLMTASSGAFDKINLDQPIPFFYQAFYTMSAICVFFYVLLVFFSIQIIRTQKAYIWPLTILLVSEVIYFFALGTLWLHPKWGMSIGAATGVANGGLMIQFVILFPLWAPILLLVVNHLSKKTANKAIQPTSLPLGG